MKARIGRLNSIVILIFSAFSLFFGYGNAEVCAGEIHGRSTTLPYFWSESFIGEDKSYLALYEFAEVGAYDVGVQGMDFYFSGWGRMDTMEKLDPEEDAIGDAELGSAYFRWRHEEGYIDVSLGRRFLFIGPVSERIDGLTAQIEPFRGIGLQAFGGIPVISNVGERDGDYGFGGRAYGRYRHYFELGASAASFTEKGDPDRLRVGGDLSVFPAYWMDFLGHAYVDVLYGSLYDVDALMVFRPVSDLKLLAQYEQIMPSAYLGMGSIFSVFSFDTINKANGEARYIVLNRVALSGQFNHYIYDSSDNANRYGGSVGVLWGERRNNTFDVGLFNLDREDNGYMELRGYLYQDLGSKLYLTLDAIGYFLDEKLYDVGEGFNGAGSFGWHVTEDLDIQASGFYAVSPYYDQDLRALIKVAYNFDVVF